jgi:hypothetical protein
MITSNVVDDVDVLNPLPLHVILAQRPCCLVITPYHDRPTQREV